MLVVLLLKRAETSELLGVYSNAMSDYDRALGIDNSNIYIYEKRSHLYFKSGNYDAALRDCETIIKLDSHNISAMYHKGIILEKQGKIFKAKDVLEESLQLNPEPTLRAKINAGLDKITDNIFIHQCKQSIDLAYCNDFPNAIKEAEYILKNNQFIKTNKKIKEYLQKLKNAYAETLYIKAFNCRRFVNPNYIKKLLQKAHSCEPSPDIMILTNAYDRNLGRFFIYPEHDAMMNSVHMKELKKYLNDSK